MSRDFGSATAGPSITCDGEMSVASTNVLALKLENIARDFVDVTGTTVGCSIFFISFEGEMDVTSTGEWSMKIEDKACDEGGIVFSSGDKR